MQVVSLNRLLKAAALNVNRSKRFKKSFAHVGCQGNFFDYKSIIDKSMANIYRVNQFYMI